MLSEAPIFRIQPLSCASRRTWSILSCLRWIREPWEDICLMLMCGYYALNIFKSFWEIQNKRRGNIWRWIFWGLVELRKGGRKFKDLRGCLFWLKLVNGRDQKQTVDGESEVLGQHSGGWKFLLCQRKC